jgi:hypothetical protein
LPSAGPATAAPSIPVAIDVEDIDARRASNLERRNEVVAVAPVMPMKLIAPVNVRAAAAPAAAGIVLELRSACVGPGCGHYVRETRRRPHQHERHQHGNAARSGRCGVVGTEVVGGPTS